MVKILSLPGMHVFELDAQLDARMALRVDQWVRMMQDRAPLSVLVVDLSKIQGFDPAGMRALWEVARCYPGVSLRSTWPYDLS